MSDAAPAATGGAAARHAPWTQPALSVVTEALAPMQQRPHAPGSAPGGPGGEPQHGAPTLGGETLGARWRCCVAANALSDNDRRVLHDYVLSACKAEHAGCIALHDIEERDLVACSSRGSSTRPCTACAAREPCYNLGLHVVRNSHTDFIIRWMRDEQLEANIGRAAADAQRRGSGSGPQRDGNKTERAAAKAWQWRPFSRGGSDGGGGGGGGGGSGGAQLAARPRLFLYATRSTSPLLGLRCTVPQQARWVDPPAPVQHRTRRRRQRARAPAVVLATRAAHSTAERSALLGSDDDDDNDNDDAYGTDDADDVGGSGSGSGGGSDDGGGDGSGGGGGGGSDDGSTQRGALQSSGAWPAALGTPGARLGALWRDVHVAANATTDDVKQRARELVHAWLQQGNVGALPLRRLHMHELQHCDADADACALCGQGAQRFGSMHIVPYTQAHLFIEWLVHDEELAVDIEYAPPARSRHYDGSSDDDAAPERGSGGGDDGDAALGDTQTLTNYVLSVSVGVGVGVGVGARGAG